MKVSAYLLLVLLIQSCIPQKTLQKKDVSLQRAPELNRPAQKDIAEVEIFVKEVSPKDRKKDVNSDKAKQKQLTTNNRKSFETAFDIDGQKQNQNNKSSQNQNSLSSQKKITARSKSPLSSQERQGSTSIKTAEESKRLETKPETENIGSSLQANQSDNYYHNKEINSSKYGKKSAYAQGFQPTQEETEPKKEDDIIAKQLKDAATKETDSNLRKKLWYEYERYKSNL